MVKISTLVNILVALLVFGILVLVHEFGHFIVAKKNGIFVEEFAIGMGPKLISFTLGETVYSLRALPLGGFCKMLGEESESLDERSFSQKSVGARMSVIAAGPIMNFLLALVILFIFASSNGYSTTQVDVITDNSPASRSELQPGDIIKKIDGKSMHIFQDITFYFTLEATGEPIKLTVLRDGERKDVTIQPEFNDKTKSYQIGIVPVREQGNFLGAIGQSFWEMLFYIKMTVEGFVQLITGQVSPDNVAGPIGIINIIGEQYEEGIKTSLSAAISNLAGITVLLSANLGVLNLLPIPALDGSRLVFLIIEAIRKKPINATIENTVHLVGFALLMLLMVVIAYNDLVRLFVGG